MIKTSVLARNVFDVIKLSLYIDKAFFGSFPTQEEVLKLEDEGVVFFVNLTNNYERKITPYHTSKEYLQYPIKDRNIPRNNKSFARLILTIENKIKDFKDKDKLYLHCKGGHGRSGIVVAILLAHMFNLPPSQAIEYTTKYHNTREMKEKWKRIGSPQTREQKEFVNYFCKDIFFSDNDQVFSLSSPHKIYIPDFGVFPTAQALLEAYKDPENKDFIEKLKETKNSEEAIKLGKKIKNSYWEKNLETIVFTVLKYKFDQHLILYNKLINTGLSKFYYISDNINLGTDKNKKGTNILGKQLCVLRNYYYRN